MASHRSTWGNTRRSATRATVIHCHAGPHATCATDLVYSQTKFHVDSQKHEHLLSNSHRNTRSYFSRTNSVRAIKDTISEEKRA